MMRRVLAAVLVALVAWAAMAATAGASPPSLDIASSEVGDDNEVTLVVRAPAELAGRQLTAADLRVSEDGEPLEATVSRIAAEGLEVVVLIDSSGSMEGAPMEAARHAAGAFVLALPPGTSVAVVGFGVTPHVASPFSTDVAAKVAAIDGIDASGETALYDAIVAAATLPSDSTSARRAIVVLSDGGDTVSGASIDDALAALASSGSTASVVALASDESDPAALQRIADANGGSVVGAGDPEALSAAFEAVRADLTGRYVVSFTATGRGRTPIELRLERSDLSLSATTVLDLPGSSRPGVVATTTPPTRTTTVDPGPFGGAALVGGAVLVGAALAIVAAVVIAPGRRRVRLDQRTGATASSGASRVANLTQRATLVAERTMAKGDRRKAMETLLEQGGIALRAGEIVLIAAGVSLLLLLLGTVVAGPVVGVVVAALPALATRPALQLFASRRRNAFAEQLDSLLQMLAGGLRAGYGLLQAMEAASREMEAPAGDELQRFITEVRLGRDVVDSLDAMAVRVGNEDFGWVARAIRIHREVGGDLSEVLDRVSETIRARGRLKRQVQALSAEGRISAYVLLTLPFVITIGISVLNPGFIAPLFTTSAGYVLLGVAAVLMTTGSLWLKRLVRPIY